MRKLRASPFSAVMVMMSIAFSALPAGARDCMPTVADGWVRLPPVSMPMLAGFGRIGNDCAKPLAIVGVGSPAFEDVSLHETSIVDGVSRMRPVPELRLAANGGAVLQPGGMHLMLMQPRTPLEAGDVVVVEFTLEDGRVLSGEFEVRQPGG